MNILALDSATSACSAAILRGDAVCGRKAERMERGQAEALMPMIVSVLEQADAGFSELDALAVTVGPGSFTGLRVGLAAARGLSLACGIPVVGVTTLEAVAYAVVAATDDDGGSDGCILAAIETKRADVYIQFFAADATPLSKPMAAPPDEIASAAPAGLVRVAGDAAPRTAAALIECKRKAYAIPGIDVPDAADVARLAAVRAARDGLSPASNQPEPLYIYPPRARLPVGGGRLRP